MTIVILIIQYGDGSKPWYLVNPKIAGKWMFIPLKMVLIGIDPYPYYIIPNSAQKNTGQTKTSELIINRQGSNAAIVQVNVSNPHQERRRDKNLLGNMSMICNFYILIGSNCNLFYSICEWRTKSLVHFHARRKLGSPIF